MKCTPAHLVEEQQVGIETEKLEAVTDMAVAGAAGRAFAAGYQRAHHDLVAGGEIVDAGADRAYRARHFRGQ